MFQLRKPILTTELRTSTTSVETRTSFFIFLFPIGDPETLRVTETRGLDWDLDGTVLYRTIYPINTINM